MSEGFDDSLFSR